MNKHFVSNKDESIRMFSSDLLEKFTHVHPLVPHTLYIPTIVVTLWLGDADALNSALMFAAGVFLWTFVEYIMHRFVFHAPAEVMEGTHVVVADTKQDEAVVPRLPTWRHKVYFIAHGVHHDYPSDSSRLVLPPGASVPLAVLFWLLFQWAMGPYAAPALFAGFVFGYLIYDSIHFAVHHFAVPTRAGRYLKRSHHRHHFLDPDQDYGVSSPIWDVVMGTLGKRRVRGR